MSGLDALWASLPLLTLPNSQWCARMGLGLGRAVGQPHGVSHSARAFEDVATWLVPDARGAHGNTATTSR